MLCETKGVSNAGKQVMYCHGSPLVQVRTSEADISMRNCASYSNHAILPGAF